MRPRIVLVVALTLALIAVLGGVAYGQILPETPYVSPTDCNSCHGIAGDRSGGPADFSVGAVNLAACAACHANLPGMGHFHRGYSFCRPCHNGSGTLKLLAEPTGVDLLDGPGLNTPNGVFDGAASLTMSATQLHAIHSGANWIESSQGSKTFANYPACSNCHAAAACSACHSDVRPTHDRHATPSYPGVARREATGSSFSTDVVTCVDSACHALPALSTPTCNSCHPESGDVSHQVPHVATEGVTEGISCSACHALDMLSEHAKPTASSSPSGCAACHPTPAATVKPWNQSCATGGCHTQTSNAPMHANTSTKHAVSAENALCLECHAGTELGSIHAGAESKASPGATSCLVCHSASKVPATADCITCHFTFSAHYDATRHQSASITCGGSGCHDTPGLVSVHSQRNATFGCFGCHNSPRQKVQDAIDAGLTGCDDCHGAVSGLGGHRDAHAAVPPLATGTTPNYSYSSGSRGTAPTGDCAGCHTSNLVDEHMGLTLGATVFFPRFDASGAALTCGTCHDQPAGSTVQNAIAAGLSACESCHPVHAPIQDAHASTFVDTPGSPCADCHDANIANEHNGTYRSAARLTGCGVCHALYSGMTSGPVTGAATQAAISVGNDTRCSACHVAYHTDTTAHTARSAPSQECTTCHDEGGAKTIDVLAIHAGASLGPCKVCHTNPTRVPDITLETAECASCHAEVGVDYHKTMAVNHTFGAMDESCSSGTTCHAAKTLPEEHARFVGVGNKYSEYADSCALCHTNTDPARIPASATADCSSCHEVHGDIDTLHTATGSDGCTRCHDETAPDGFQLSAIHTTNGCSTCHNTTFDLTGKTAECITCHNTTVSPFHGAMAGAHEFTAMNADCTQAGCHVKTLPEEHAKYISRYPAYTDTCALCHLNTVAGRIPADATAACVSCHTVHGDITTIHTATASQSCVACHETGSALDVHLKKDGSGDTDCALCHSASVGRINWDPATVSIECTYCHGPASAKPLDPADHYPTAAHDATAETDCNQCHYKDMKAEHSKPTVSPAVTCVSCHETKVDGFTSAWDKTCAACHTAKHGAQNTKHVSSTTTCSGAGCHVITDVAALHDVAGGPGCGACHAPAAPATTTTCTTAGCHPNVGANHHESHNAAVANPGGCNGCHQLYLDDEHARLGMTCDTCHKSAVPAVVTAIAAGDLRCKSCHPTMHSAQDWEFNPGSASMHRVSSALPGMRTSFPVNGATYTWSLPSASSFLKTGWTTSSVMGCDACHTYTGATGPQGATMKVNMDPAYPTLYSNGILSPSSASGMSTGLICSKCHDLNGSGSSWSNIVHKEHDDRGMSEGGRCVSCHVRIPHGAKRPRLLGASTDPAPYTTVSGGMIEFRLKSYTPNGWQKSDCYAACSTGRHPNQSSPWPAVGGTAPAPSTGVVSGTVTKSTGGALSGATVGMAGKTATSGTGGTYSIADITAGTYTMTISATGYTTWTGQVLITAGGTATQNIALTLTPPVITTGNVSGTVTKSTGGGLSGATVSIGGKTATSGTGGTYSITAITAGTYTMTVSATGYTTWTGQVLITAGGTATQNIALPPVVPTATNIARTGTAGASSQDSYSYGASRAIDGSTSTYWRSNGNGTEWLRVDLGSAKTFDKVVVNWYGSRYARSYRIETSNDGSTWSSRYSTSSGNGDIDTLTFAPISVRYVRVYCTDNNDSDYRITEFEVWGY